MDTLMTAIKHLLPIRSKWIFIIRATLCLVVFCVAVSCAKYVPSPRSIASIRPTSGWSIDHKCGYKRKCLRLYDYLIWDDIEILLEPLNDNAGPEYSERLYLRVYFETPATQSFSFNPSLSYLIAENGDKVQSTGSIAATESEEYRFRDYDYKKPIRLGSYRSRDKRTNEDPFMLIFDYPAPEVSEEFSVQINGFSKDGKEIQIPLLHFAPGIDEVE